MPVLSPHRSSASGLAGTYRSTFSGSPIDRYGSAHHGYSSGSSPRLSQFSERYTTRSYTDADGKRVYSRSGSITEDGVTTRFGEEFREANNGTMTRRGESLARYNDDSLPLSSTLRRGGNSRYADHNGYQHSRNGSIDSTSSSTSSRPTINVFDSVAEMRNKYSAANYIPACQRQKYENISRSKSINDIGLPPIDHHNGGGGGSAAATTAATASTTGSGYNKKKDIAATPKLNSSLNNKSSATITSNNNNNNSNNSTATSSRRSTDRDNSHRNNNSLLGTSNNYITNNNNNNNSDVQSSSSSSSPKTTTLNNNHNTFTTSSTKTLGLNGLKNIGNTCFMNSVIQCLSNTKLLLEYLRGDSHMNDINTSISSMKGALIKSFADVIKEVWSDEGGVVNTVSLKSQIQRFAPRFIGYAQQDAQEFLRYLLEGLHEDVNRVKEKPKPILTEIDEKLSDQEKSAESWSRYLRMDNSKIVDCFVGQLKSTLKCTHCGHCSVTFDPFWDLSLPIPQRTGQLRLSQCLDSFTREETLDGDEKPTCSKCKERRKCTKSFSIQKFPKILVIHLKRFSPTERFRGKLNVTVDFPLEGLDMSQYSADNLSTGRYNLYAISNHSGTTYSGHYTAYCRHPYQLNWHEYNDSRVSSISSKSIVSGEAYVLFYEQESQKSHL